MSAVAIQAALETAVAAISPALGTASANMPYTPVSGTPYQRVAVLFADPANLEIGRSVQERGLLKIGLAYPLGAGSGAALARAELIRDTFYRGRSFVASGITTTIENTPAINTPITEPDRYVVPVTIRFFSNYAA